MVLLGVQPRQTNNLGGIKRKKQKTKNKKQNKNMLLKELFFLS